MGLTRPRAYQIFDIDYKQSVRVVTVSNVTLSGGAPSQVDGVSLSLNDRVLVTGQTTGSQNGLYYVTTVGAGSNGTWARSIDGNETGEIQAGMIVMVTEGTTYADTQWKLTTDDPITIGSTALTFVPNVQANSISSGTSNVVVTANANVTISSAGTANVLTISSDTATLAGNLVPSTDLTYSLGNATRRWSNLYLAGNTIYLGNAVITENAQGDVVIENTGSFAVPVGNTSQRSAVQGAIRYNTTVGAFETYDGAGWNTLAYGTATDFPYGDYGNLDATTDAFGVSLATGFDCNSEGPMTLVNLGTGEDAVSS